MFRQGVCIFLLKQIFEFLVLGKNFMWMWLNIWWGKNINQECISSHGNLHENFCYNKQRPRPSFSTKVSLLIEILHVFMPMLVFNYMTYHILILAMYVSNKGFTLEGLMLWCFKVKTPCMLIHLWIILNKPRQSNDDKIFWKWNDIENNLASVGANGNI